MAKRIDWYYHRKGWTSCKRSDGFLEGRDVTVRETVNATKQRYGSKDLAGLFEDASKVVVCKGKKTQVLDLKKEPPTSKELADYVLGPTGNLRAPALKLGKTWLIGFNEEAYAERFD